MPTIAPSIDITADTTIDTTANASDLRCTQVSHASPSFSACVLAAGAIRIAPGARLSARGTRPLALFAHTITIAGTLDVASHVNASPGAGARLGGCTAGVLAKGAGGGRGGAAVGLGGDGGNEGVLAGTGADGGGTFLVVSLAGGCGGTRGGDGSILSSALDVSDNGDSTGGAGGGAIWIYADRDPLVIAAGAVINASGAPGAGGRTPGHGGSGGGAGGLIVLHAASIQIDPGARIFANGGPGGGGAGINDTAADYQGGTAGSEPDAPGSGGTAGQGGTDGGSGPPAADDSDGGVGYPGSPTRGHDGGNVPGRGGGGGGGGEGAIRVISTNNISPENRSPTPVLLPQTISPAW